MAYFWPTFGLLLADFWPTFGRLWADFWPTLGRLLADFVLTLGPLSASFRMIEVRVLANRSEGLANRNEGFEGQAGFGPVDKSQRFRGPGWPRPCR